MQFAMILLPALLLGQSGLKSTDIKVGKGDTAKAGDQVTVHYTGTLTNGKKFDSSLDRKEPFKFILGAGMVIKGWDQGVSGMKIGGKRKLTIPPSLGYGSQDMGEIPPNSTLVFEIELLATVGPKVQTIVPGKGPAAAGGDAVTLHYKGTFTDGKKFDSSYDRGTPMTITLGRDQMIPGFTGGIIGAKQGEKRKITIPPALGYGSVARGPIPANSTLIFEIEIVSLKKN